MLCRRRRRTSGNAAAEAAAVGLPVVVSDACGVAEILDPSAHRVIGVGDVDALTAAVDELIRGDEPKRAAAAAAPALRKLLRLVLAGRCPARHLPGGPLGRLGNWHAERVESAHEGRRHSAPGTSGWSRPRRSRPSVTRSRRSIPTPRRSPPGGSFDYECKTVLPGAEVVMICVSARPRPRTARPTSRPSNAPRWTSRATPATSAVVVGKSTVPAGTVGSHPHDVRARASRRERSTSSPTPSSSARGPAFTIPSSPTDSWSERTTPRGSMRCGASTHLRAAARPRRPPDRDRTSRPPSCPSRRPLPSSRLKISRANALARVCELLGADVDAVTHVIQIEDRSGLPGRGHRIRRPLPAEEPTGRRRHLPERGHLRHASC